MGGSGDAMIVTVLSQTTRQTFLLPVTSVTLVTLFTFVFACLYMLSMFYKCYMGSMVSRW